MPAINRCIALNAKAIQHFNQNEFGEAIALYQQALLADPSAPYTYNNLALAYYSFGMLAEAVDCCQHALNQDPGNLNALSNLLYYQHYREHDLEEAFRLHLEYAKRVHPEGLSESPTFPNSPLPERPLRIGYVSPDFKGHSVAYFIEPVLRSHDRAQYQLYGYANVGAPDLHTQRFQTYFDGWRDIHGVSDEDVGAQIREDGIDVLVDLAGHTSENRLKLFTRKLAPIQMAWLGYFNTTGLRTMDFLISDPVSTPEGDSQPFTERLLRLPQVRLCYQPPSYAPPVTSLPCLEAPFTFGCFNNIAKHSEDTLRLWARILIAVPHSRLLLKASAFASEELQRRYRDFFAEAGVSPERLILRGLSAHPAMLSEYGDVDIALDPSPFTGGLTTCEALWQGVPVLTLRGNSLISRQSASFLEALGLHHWIASSPEDYERKAVALAQNVCSLILLRGRLRQRMQGSPICDYAGFTRALEGLYRQAWQGWCHGKA